MVIGYTETTKIWKLGDPQAKRMTRNADVIFIEEENAIGKKEIDLKTRELDMMDVDLEDNTQATQKDSGHSQISWAIEEDSDHPQVPRVTGKYATDTATQSKDPNDMLLSQVDKERQNSLLLKRTMLPMQMYKRL